MQKRRFFNMVEILLAMGVTAIGIAGLCAVLPVGLISSRDAYQTSCICLLMEDIYDRLNCWCGTEFDRVAADEYDVEWHRPTLERNIDSKYGYETAFNPSHPYFESPSVRAYANSSQNSSFLYNGFSCARGAITGYMYASDHWRIWPVPFTPVGKQTVPFLNTEDKWDASDVFSDTSDAISWRGSNGAYNYYESGYKEVGTLTPGLLRFRMFNDFAGEVRIWKQLPQDVSGYKGNSLDKEPALIRVYLEFSYPSNTKYENRTKRTFVREFYAWRKTWLPVNADEEVSE